MIARRRKNTSSTECSGCFHSLVKIECMDCLLDIDPEYCNDKEKEQGEESIWFFVCRKHLPEVNGCTNCSLRYPAGTKDHGKVNKGLIKCPTCDTLTCSYFNAVLNLNDWPVQCFSCGPMAMAYNN